MCSARAPSGRCGSKAWEELIAARQRGGRNDAQSAIATRADASEFAQLGLEQLAYPP
jgi:hypothetical protein